MSLLQDVGFSTHRLPEQHTHTTVTVRLQKFHLLKLIFLRNLFGAV